MSTKHICPLKRGILEVPADAPKTAKEQCMITRVVKMQITNQSKVLISFGKKELSI